MAGVDPGKGIVRFLRANGEIEGVGFLVGPRRILTCAHVFEKVREDNSAKVDFPLVEGGREVTARLELLYPKQANPKPGQMEDIAILAIPEDEDLPQDLVPLARTSIPDAELKDRKVELYGFPADLARDYWSKMTLNRPASDGRIQLDPVPGSRPVVKGYSGGPVWDSRSESVAGMVVAVNWDAEDEVAAAYMIPASVLNRAVGAEEEKLVSFPPNLAWKCNRDDEFRSFSVFLENKRDSCDTRHPVFFLPGDGEANHEFFIRRLCHSPKVLRHFSSSANGDPAPAHLIKVPWPDETQPDFRLRGLLEKLFDQICVGSEIAFSGKPDPAAFADVCRRQRFSEYPAVMLFHRIPWEVWDRPAVGVLREYLRDFWAQVPLENLPRFFLFLCFITPKPGQVGYRRWRWLRGRNVCRRVESTLRGLEGEGVCLCHGFDELKSIRERHVHSWFDRRDTPPWDETEFPEKMDILFQNRSDAPMAKVQTWLAEVIRTANKTLSRPYLDENGASTS